MRIKSLIYVIVLLASAFGLKARAQYDFKKPLDIHVEGNQLVDVNGHPVRFFGFMDTPSCWFNDGRWGWGKENDSGVSDCKTYFNKLFTATTDSTNGAFANIFRLHMEPAWVGGSTTYCRFCGKSIAMGTAKGATCKYCKKPCFYQTGGKTYDPDDQEVGGEADTHTRDMAKVKKYLGSVYYPLAEAAHKKGMYVVMRPPGVCPGKIKVGSYYQQYLIDVWDIVSQNAKVKAASGWLSIELANEPVGVVDANGQDTKTAMRDFFQPIVDKIRANGFEGIIWVPGKGWQASYENYKDYPVEDANMGYAVHNYTGWYGGSDGEYDRGKTVAQYTNQFHNQVPVVDTNPIVITEVDWSPEKKSEEGKGHVNEHGEWVDGNYGTWATGSTSKWGVLYKGLLDRYDNISMTLSSTACYIDIDASLKNKGYAPVPAFKTKMEADGRDPWDGSGVACFKWYRDYYYQQHDGYSNDNITIKEMKTTSIRDLVLSPGGHDYVTINASFVSGRSGNVAQSCTYTVADPTIAKVFHGKVIGLAVGETDIVAAYNDITGASYEVPFHVNVTYFPLTKGAFNPAVVGNGTYGTVTATTFVHKGVKNGLGGWNYGETGVDISAYDSLAVTLNTKPTTASKASLRIFDQPDFNGAYAEIPLAGTLGATVKLTELVKTDGTALNLNKICAVCIYTAAAADIRIKAVELLKASEEDTIAEIKGNAGGETEVYTADGIRTNRLQKGVNIIRMPDGSTKKMIIR